MTPSISLTLFLPRTGCPNAHDLWRRPCVRLSRSRRKTHETFRVGLKPRERSLVPEGDVGHYVALNHHVGIFCLVVVKVLPPIFVSAKVVAASAFGIEGYSTLALSGSTIWTSTSPEIAARPTTDVESSRIFTDLISLRSSSVHMVRLI